MSKVEELLAKYNPNGVSSISLADVLDYEQPSRFIVSSSEYDDNYDIPVLTAGQTFILGYTNEKEGVYKASKNNPTIIFDDFTTGYHWVDFDFKVKSSAMKMLRLKNNKSLLRYVFHSMALINYSPTEHSRQWISKYSHFEIPLPHIKVQEEIVKILDSFTNLIDALNEELSLRQKQFEYYREKLLNSKECSYTEKLQFFAKIMNGKDYKHLGEGNIPLMGSGGVMGYVDSSLYEKVSVLLPRKGSIDKVYYIEEPFWTVDTLYWTKIDDNKIIPKFLYYVLSSIHIEKYALQGGIPSLTQSILYNIDIPKIDKTIQQSIVEKLDAFESLISSLKEEIALRQKQYEYYREKLLTFE